MKRKARKPTKKGQRRHHPAARKSGRKSGRPGTFAPGKDARRGRGPKKGAPNAGRPTNAFRQQMRGIASSEEVVGVIWTMAQDDTRPELQLKAIEFATKHGYGNPVQSMEHSGLEGGPIQHKHELGNLNDAELEQLERLRRKMGDTG